MFDPQTTVLIRHAPELADLDRQRLPEDFTKAFSAIVSFRLHISGGGATLPGDLRQQLDRFRRLAATFEAMVTLLPERPDRRSAAFVAAQAHHLLYLAREAERPGRNRHLPLREDAIAPEVSSLLLFLIANQPSDAMEMARELTKLRERNVTASGILLDALCALAFGRLREISHLSGIELPEWPRDSCDAAVQALYRRLFDGVRLLSDFILDAETSPRGQAEAVAIFEQVQRLSLEREPWPFVAADPAELPPLSAFAGPHHLACLLVAAADLLGGSALSIVPPPPGIPGSSWRAILRPIVDVRPFLWPNHLEALEKGFLISGTSSVISFPTGAGKTTLSELKAASILAMGGAVIYLAPTHALVSQMKADLATAFPSADVRDSLLVEDFYAEVGETFATTKAQVVVMTPERCLALLSQSSGDFAAVGLVIFDECHLIHPRTSGQNRRSLDAMLALLHLQHAAPNADWLLLSAMMANGDELAGWIQDLTGRPCLSLNLDWKPTRQARGCLVYDRDELARVRAKLRGEAVKASKPSQPLGNPGAAVQRSLTANAFGFFSLLQTWQTREIADYVLLPLLPRPVPLTASRSKSGHPTWYPTPNKNEVASHIAAECVRAGLKVLLFVQSTLHAGSLANAIGKLADCGNNAPVLDEHERHLLSVAAEEAGSTDAVLTPSGCAGCHHGNMLVAERELAESLFRRTGGISALAATATLAQGMNLPADIVLIVGEERFDTEADAFAPLDAHELLNAAGRAGRAGLVAQGLVIVIPHTFVDFDPQTNGIGARWAQLQESVFSRADQCLLIQDPVKHFLDRIQDATTADDPDVRYFLRRIPRASATEPDAPKRFLRSTLAGWYARQSLQREAFEKLIALTIKRRSEMDPLAGDETWRDELAYRTGVPLEFVEDLHRELLRVCENPPESTEGWVRWFFGWLGSDQSRLDAVFGHRLPPNLRADLSQGDLLGGKLSDAVWGWMSGETLLVLNTRLGGKVARPGKCEKARKFVLKMIPDLAFAAGLATRVRRAQLEDSDEQLPLVLATLALCVREGLAEPELAALKINQAPTIQSRIRVMTDWSQVRRFASRRRGTETFGTTRQRVREALSRAEAQGGLEIG